MKNFKLETNQKITSGFKIPDNYFDSLSEKINQQVPSNEPKVISFYAKYSRMIYAVAAVILLTFSIPIANQLQQNNTENTSNDMANYITHYTNISDDDIISLLDQEDIENITIDNSIEAETLKEVLSDNAQLEDYITN